MAQSAQISGGRMPKSTKAAGAKKKKKKKKAPSSGSSNLGANLVVGTQAERNAIRMRVAEEDDPLLHAYRLGDAQGGRGIPGRLASPAKQRSRQQVQHSRKHGGGGGRKGQRSYPAHDSKVREHTHHLAVKRCGPHVAISLSCYGPLTRSYRHMTTRRPRGGRRPPRRSPRCGGC